MKINVTKTKVLVFRKGGQLPRNLSFIYEGEALEIVTSFKYLGIVLLLVGHFPRHIVHLRGKHKRLFLN